MRLGVGYPCAFLHKAAGRAPVPPRVIVFKRANLIRQLVNVQSADGWGELVGGAYVDGAVYYDGRGRDDGLVLGEQLYQRGAGLVGASGGVEDHGHAVVFADVDQSIGDGGGGEDGGLGSAGDTDPECVAGGGAASGGGEGVEQIVGADVDNAVRDGGR